MNASAGDTVNEIKTNRTCSSVGRMRAATSPGRDVARGTKRRLETNREHAEVPAKTKRRDRVCPSGVVNDEPSTVSEVANQRIKSKRQSESPDARSDCDQTLNKKKRNDQQAVQSKIPPGTTPRKDDGARLRKTIQWLEEGARRLREELASARSDLHEERRAMKMLRRELDAAVREARSSEASKYQLIISELKTRSTRATESPSPAARSNPRTVFAREEELRCEQASLRRRLDEAETVIKTLRGRGASARRPRDAASANADAVRRLEAEVRDLRKKNNTLEVKLQMSQEAERIRGAELRAQHERHEAELAALRKSLRSETIKMMDELRGKSREIEKLTRIVRDDESRKRCRTTTRNDEITMRKLRESERSGPIRPASRVEKKVFSVDNSVDEYVQDIDCDGTITEVEVERLRELALEQQEVIEILRQALKEKERKLDQLTNKKRKEEFYKQWLELEPVAEVEDEEDREEGDSALSSAPSSLSPQPGQWQANAITREAYETALIEIEELQAKLQEERDEVAHARNQVSDLEKALLQETRCAGKNKELNELNNRLRESEEREATLLAELSELREQNELLEFRLLELEELSARRDSPDHTADSGVVSPEPMNLYKDHTGKQRNRAVATVIPYTTSLNRTISPVPQKPPLSLQESGIFEDEEETDNDFAIELSSQGTQTEEPAGELLQEVQRLQELRARLQQRAVKVNTPNKASGLVLDNELVEPIEQQPSHQERIRELEERLGHYAEAETKQTQEMRVIKQREDELLDENYKLTERVYWLENELRNAEYVVRKLDIPSKEIEEDKRTEDKSIQTVEELLDCSRCSCTKDLTTDEAMITSNVEEPVAMENEEAMSVDETDGGSGTEVVGRISQVLVPLADDGNTEKKKNNLNLSTTSLGGGDLLSLEVKVLSPVQNPFRYRDGGSALAQVRPQQPRRTSGTLERETRGTIKDNTAGAAW